MLEDSIIVFIILFQVKILFSFKKNLIPVA